MIVICAVVLASCGTSKVVNEARKTINGEWTLSSITFPGNSNNLDVKLFNDATASCLENSTWSFVSNNNSGFYTVSGMSCDNTDNRYFQWSVDKVNAGGNFDFMLKPTDAQWNSTTDAGFRINLVSLTGTNMVWEQTVNFEGSPFTIQMNFNKN